MKIIEVVCALIRKDNKIFCCQRGKGKNLEDFYEFPGGKIEHGETKEDALIREIKEELNSDISVDEYITTIEHDYPLFHLTMHAFWCTLVKGKLELLEHKESKWATIDEMKDIKFAPADLKVIDAITPKSIDRLKLTDIKIYIDNHLVVKKKTVKRQKEDVMILCDCIARPSLYDDIDDFKERIDRNIDSSWQRTLFTLLDERKLDEVEVYKKGGLTKQTFSKIRSNENYHPDKDTAIRLCIGMELSLDDALDLLGKAGYTLSKSIARDLVFRYYFEHKEYDIYEIDCVLEELGMKQLLKY